jgi:hypothetical protein
MLNKSPWVLKRVVMSLKVAALVTVLGTVVLAAERQLLTEVSPEAAPGAPAASEQQAPADYFPSQFAEPKGEPAQQPPTFCGVPS